MLIEGRTPPENGALLFADGKQVGVITQAIYSSLTDKTMAIARFDVDAAVHGKKLEVKGEKVNGPAIAHTLPFDDPDKKKRTGA